MALRADELAERAAIYTRISSDDDPKIKGLGVKRQEQACRALVDARGWTLIDVYTDNNRSASKDTAERPAFVQLLADIAAGQIDRVVVLSQDRLVRKPDELELVMRRLNARSISTIDTVTDGPVNLGTTTGRTMARVKGVFDIAYSEAISEKVRAKKMELAERGLPSGGGDRRPFGYEIDRMTVVPAEAASIQEAARRLLAGDTLYGIAKDWQTRGLATVTGRPWVPNVLRGILTSPRIAGLRSHRGEIVGQAAWEAILDRSTWEQICALAAAPSRRRVGRPPRLLTGILRCGECGTRMLAATNNGKRAYACRTGPGRAGCGKIIVIADPVEEIVQEAVLQALDTPALTRAVRDQGAKNRAGAGQDLTALEARRAELAAMYAAGDIDRAQWVAAKKVLDDRIASEHRRLESDAESALMAPYKKAGVLRRAWPDLSSDQQRRVLAAVVETVTVAPAVVRGRHSFDPDRLDITWRA